MKRALLTLLPALLLLSACSMPGGEEFGRAQVLLTDAPAAEADTVPVTFSQIELVGAAQGVVAVEVGPKTVDVLTLRNGGLELLGEVELPVGTYSQLRLIVDEANLTFEGDPEIYPVVVPSGAQTGLKISIEPALVVEPNQTSQVILDFDAQRGLVETPPASGNYILVPSAVRAVTTSGTVEGSVVAVGPAEGDSVEALANVTVVVYDEAGDEVTATVTEADGGFRFITLLEGSYDLVFSLDGYASHTIEAVGVVAGETTALGEIEMTSSR